MPETWLDVARDARKAANTLATQDRFRSCVARAYYAAFSKVMHELAVTAAPEMPPGREGFSHARLRPVTETSMPHMAQDKREKLSELIGRLYTLRVDADYKPSVEVQGAEAREAVSIMKRVLEAF